MLDLEHVHCHYGKSHVLRDVSLRVEPGEIVSVIGPNAAGKTTTLRVIAGLKAPSAGAVRFDGVDISRKPPFARVQKQVTNGGAIMPAFKGVLTKAQIDAVARYVSSHAGKK